MTKDDQALNQDIGDEANVSATPAEEPKATEEVEVEPTQAEPTSEAKEGETETETVESSKKGAQRRIRQLVSKVKQAENKTQGLTERLKELTSPVGSRRQYQPSTPSPQPIQPIVQPGEEIDVEEFNRRQANRDARILQQAASIAELKSRQSEAIIRINSEAQEVLKNYPELDPNSKSFDKELSESVTEATLAFVKGSPYTASPKKFVEKMMKSYHRAVAKKIGQTSENLVKQVAQKAQRPTGISKREKGYQEKSIKELEDELGIEY